MQLNGGNTITITASVKCSNLLNGEVRFYEDQRRLAILLPGMQEIHSEG